MSEETTAPEKKEKVLLDIINGRMPLPLVYIIRFEESADAKDSELAAKYKTSVGKISDIRKNRNFGYITEGLAFTQADVDGANAYLAKTTLKGNSFTDDEKNDITSKLDALPVDDAAAAAITEARKANRKTSPKKDKADDAPAAEAGASDDLDAVI